MNKHTDYDATARDRSDFEAEAFYQDIDGKEIRIQGSNAVARQMGERPFTERLASKKPDQHALKK